MTKATEVVKKKELVEDDFVFPEGEIPNEPLFKERVTKITPKKMNFWEKLHAIDAEVGIVNKGLTIGSNSFSYKAVGEADVLGKIKPLLEKHRIFTYPVNRKILESFTYENTDKYGKTSSNFFMRVETTLRILDIDNPSDYIDVIGYGDGIDSQDKAPGKAITYSDKYCLLKAFKMISGDDPDQFASEDGEKKVIDKKPVDKQSYGDYNKNQTFNTVTKGNKNVQEPKGNTSKFFTHEELLAVFKEDNKTINDTITELIKGRKYTELGYNEQVNLYNEVQKIRSFEKYASN